MTTTKSALIRPARMEDAEPLTVLGRVTFVDTFVDGFGIPYPADDLKVYLDDQFDVAKMRAHLADPTEAWWVAEAREAGELIGYANTGPSALPHPEVRASHAELRKLYVVKHAQGTGLGTRLLALALDWMKSHTDGPMWISVWSGNLRAQKLYANYGFTKAGEYKYPIGSWFDDEFILRAPGATTARRDDETTS